MVESMCGSLSHFIYLLYCKYFPMSIRAVLQEFYEGKILDCPFIHLVGLS